MRLLFSFHVRASVPAITSVVPRRNEPAKNIASGLFPEPLAGHLISVRTRHDEGGRPQPLPKELQTSARHRRLKEQPEGGMIRPYRVEICRYLVLRAWTQVAYMEKRRAKFVLSPIPAERSGGILQPFERDNCGTRAAGNGPNQLTMIRSKPRVHDDGNLAGGGRPRS